MHPTQLGHVKTSRRCTLSQHWVNAVFSTIFIKNQSGRHTLVQCWPKVMHPTQLSHVKTSRQWTLAQRWFNVVFSTTFIQNQTGRHMLVQCWPNVMHPTQLGHVKTSYGVHWPNVGPTFWLIDINPTANDVNVGAMLGQRCTSNPNHRPTVLPYAIWADTGAAIFFFRSVRKHKLPRWHWDLATYQVLLNSV